MVTADHDAAMDACIVPRSSARTTCGASRGYAADGRKIDDMASWSVAGCASISTDTATVART
jgi:hypothetical protein